MSVRTVVRPIQRVLAGGVVATVAVAVVVSGSSTPQAVGSGPHKREAVVAKREAPKPGKREVVQAKREAPRPGKREVVQAKREAPRPGKREVVQAKREAPKPGKREVVQAKREAPKPGKREKVRITLVAQQTAAPTPSLAAGTYETKVIKAINRVRHRHHLHRLTRQSCATRVAGRWSKRLAASDAFYHQDMGSLLKRCHARYVGETLARGAVTPNRMVRMWLNSPPHRHILLSKSPRRIGVGATPNTRGEWVGAANFMRF